MNTYKQTLSKLLFSCLAVLFSVCFFSFKSSAHVLIDLPGDLTSSLEGVSVYSADPEANFLFCFNMQSASWKPGDNYRSFTQCFVFDSRVPATVSCDNMGNPYSFKQNANLVATVDGVEYYGFSRSLNGFNAEPYWDRTFLSYEDAIRDYLSVISPAPDYAQFGLKNFGYTTHTTSLASKPKDGFILEYKLGWDGSTNPDYPITRVDYEIYGFRDRSYSNYDKSNGILLQTGEAYDGMNLDVDSAINDALNFPYDWDKVVVYFIPFSGKTEGNTEFIVCNLYKSELTLDLYGLNIPIGNLFLVKAEDGQGSIPVPYTSSVNDGTDSFPVSTIDDVPVLTIDQTISGSFNTHYDYFNSYTTYSPVIYGDTNTINNYYDQHSESITNNNDYSVIINNFNGSVDIDPESEAYSESIISFLKTLITFFSTFWSYCVVALGWLPAWVQVFVSAIFGLLGTLVISLGILKLMRGVL